MRYSGKISDIIIPKFWQSRNYSYAKLDGKAALLSEL